MNILFCGPIPAFMKSGNTGGVAMVCWDAACNSSSRGHDVDIIVLGRYLKFTKTYNKITLIGLTINPISLIKTIIGYLQGINRGYFKNASFKDSVQLFSSLYRLHCVSLRKYDVLHIHGSNYQFELACKIIDVKFPVVLTNHSYSDVIYVDNPKKVQRIIARRNIQYSNVDTLLHVSLTDRERGLYLGAKYPSNNHILHNGIQAAERDIDIKKDVYSDLCFIGSLDDRKGFKELILACDMLPPEIYGKLHILGTGLQTTWFNARGPQNNSNFVLHGYLAGEKKHLITESCLALVTPSRSESFGLIYLEALMSGTPVIGYYKTILEFRNVLDCSEQEEQYLVPFNVDHTDSINLLSIEISKIVKVKNAIEHDDVVSRLRRKIIHHYGWDRVIQDMIAIYNETINTD